MARNAYIGINGVARNIRNGYIGVHQIPQKRYGILDSITGTGTQYINTLITPSDDLKTRIILQPDPAYMSEHAILGSTWSVSGYFLMFYGSKIRWHSKGYSVDIGSFNTAGKNTIEVTPTSIAVNGTAYTLSGTGTDSIYPIHVFATADIAASPGNIGSFTMNSVQMTKGATLVRELVPAIRYSDNKVGAYDRVTGLFFENAGTGSFIAGAETGEYIYDVPQEGDYSRCLTKGYVGVNGVARLFFNSDKKLYLYNEGDECVNVTGGWSVDVLSFYPSSGISSTKNSDCFYFPPLGTYNGLGTVNEIDLSPYSKLCFTTKNIEGHAYHPRIAIHHTGANAVFDTTFEAAAVFVGTADVAATGTLDISGITGLHRIDVTVTDYNASGYLYKMWLE